MYRRDIIYQGVKRDIFTIREIFVNSVEFIFSPVSICWFVTRISQVVLVLVRIPSFSENNAWILMETFRSIYE